jgi:ubiquinone/menaquinone biosynthesis C-methylase UbiE
VGPIKNVGRGTMDTVRFDDLSPEEYKKQTQRHWTSVPCGSNYSAKEFLSKEFFDEIETHRYATHPWIIENIRRFNIKGKKVLEIGYGMGTDHLQMARRGAVMHGLDLTPASYEITKRRLEVYGFHSELTVGDAENLPYPPDSFDCVYSFGVVHHSPNTEKIISEVHRVLTPNGRCYITVYHKRSLFFWWTVYGVNYLLKGGRKVRTLREQLSLIEYPNTNPDMVIRLYTRREFAMMFDKYSEVKCYVKHLLPVDIALFSRLFKDPYRPRHVFDKLGGYVGWYVVIEASK